MNLTPFTKQDWFAYSGSEELPGEPPLIGYIDHVESGCGCGGATVIVDQSGVEVLLPQEDAPCFILTAPYRLARTVAMLLPESSISVTRLESLGFEHVLGTAAHEEVTP